MPSVAKQLRLRVRVTCGKDVAIGPGKAELLALVDETGSISEAARRMEMSYMRAWTLIQTMNQCFKEPLVASARGGKRGGGATLTATGRRALQLYQEMEEAGRMATDEHWRSFQKLLVA
jgi:molybdate transport system regulatory protein